MTKKVFYIGFVLTVNAVVFAAIGTDVFSQNTGLKERFINYIEDNSSSEPKKTSEAESVVVKDQSLSKNEHLLKPNGNGPLDMNNYRYYLYKKEGTSEEEEIYFEAYGGMKHSILYGKSYFTKSKYKTFDEDRPSSKLVNQGFLQTSELDMHIEGKIGKRLSVYIDHDSSRKENVYKMQYRAVSDDELIREINVGDIDIKQHRSKYAVFDNSSQKGLGMDMTMRKNKLTLKAFASILKGETVVESFKGNSSASYMKLSDYQYLRGTYYQIEPFKRYDGLTAAPVISLANNSYNTLVTFTSEPSTPSTYKLTPVQLDSSSFELYMDDQIATNNVSSSQLSLDGGYYNKLIPGADYRIDYNSGVINFIRDVPENSRIYALYKFSNGSTTSIDPSARTDVVSGKIFVFLKYGESIDEDTNKDYAQDQDRNGDSRINYDVYEIRSFYYLGDKNIKRNSFSLKFYKYDQLISDTDLGKLGKYQVNYNSGIISFDLREPFRSVLDSAKRPQVYSEARVETVYDYSQYKIRADYYRDARFFKLKHLNIIDKSIKVKVDGKVLPPSFYTVNYPAGIVEFVNPNYPVFGENTTIEIRYQYLPENVEAQRVVGGLRADYAFNRNFSLGATILGARDSRLQDIPDPGSESTQNIVLESDASLYLSPKNMGSIASKLTGKKIKSLPVDFRGYFEYARSYLKVNTFGKAMLDDMESTVNYLALNLSEKEWMLSAPPSTLEPAVSTTQANRARLNYYYYRDLSDTSELLGESFSGQAVDYSVKPGPFNIASGHASQLDADEQVSLVFDFDFTSDTYASVVTRHLDDYAIDLSSLQYVEIWYKAESGSTGDVLLKLDIGTLNEDSDGDGVLDTEDKNNNGVLDYDPLNGILEDRGYLFNPISETSTYVGSGPRLSNDTRGDGRITSEDLNRNGVLDVSENYIRFPDDNSVPANAKTYIPGAVPDNELRVDLAADTSWKKARIYLKRSDLTNTDLELLKKIWSVRLTLQNASATTGRIFIDSIKFVTSSWKDILINGVSQEDPSRFKVSIVDTYNDSEYKQYSFLAEQSGTYLSLYGSKDRSDLGTEYESALEVEYNLTPGDSASATRRIQRSFDLRHYRTLNMWLNVRSFTAGDVLKFYVGSSENDYLVYQVPLDSVSGWRNFKLKLNKDSSGDYDIQASSGFPDLKRIRFLRVEITGTTGRLWINNLYVSEAETVKDDAYWCESEIKIKKPLYRTAEGKPLFSDLNIKYIQREHGANYLSPGRIQNELSEKSQELYSSVMITPKLSNNLEFKYIKNSSDSFNENIHESLAGKTRRAIFLCETNYSSDGGVVPEISFQYKQENYENRRGEYFELAYLEKETNRDVYTPKIVLEQRFDNILSGRLINSLTLDLNFENYESTKENYSATTSPEITAELAKNPVEAVQKNRLILASEYSQKHFFIKPTLNIKADEFVKYKGRSDEGKSDVINEVNGGFHLPFYYNNSDFKFIERDKDVKLSWGTQNYSIVNFQNILKINYLEQNFKDYDLASQQSHSEYLRKKTGKSNINNSIVIPFDFSKTKGFKYLKSASLNYQRDVSFEEENTPYEGEHVDWENERYGAVHAWNSLAGTGLNLINNYPWKYFTGRENFAAGRDHVYNINNKPIYYNNGSEVEDYKNSLKLADEFLVSLLFDFDLVTLNLQSSLKQMSERSDLQSIPHQNVSMNYNNDLSFDLMKIFNFGFFRPNRPGEIYHSSFLNLGYGFTRNMFVTRNQREDVHKPSIGLMFKWGNNSLNFTAGLEYRHKTNHGYISSTSMADEKYYNNISHEDVDQKDKGYTFSAEYKVEVNWLYGVFLSLYKLESFPVLRIAYDLAINRYDYKYSVSPDPYDQHLLTTGLTMDLHKNVRGGLTGRMALEKYYNRDTGGLYREVFSYELGFNFELHF